MSTPRTRLVLWRHGLTDWNAEGRFQGQADIALNEIGREQALRSAAMLADLGIEAVYASPLNRAMATARTFAEPRGLEITTDERLQEIFVGDWSGHTVAEIRTAIPWFDEVMASGEDFRRSESGETATQTGERMGAVLREIADAHEGSTVLVASHGLAIRMGVANLLGWDHRTAVGLSGMLNCAVAIVVRTGQGPWRLLTWNQTDPSQLA